MKQWYYDCICGLIFYNEDEAFEHKKGNLEHRVYFNDANGSRTTELGILRSSLDHNNTSGMESKK
ncbi:MAG: hypothetical protein AABW67_00580 [Nanoarchaeota archaeon]